MEVLKQLSQTVFDTSQKFSTNVAGCRLNTFMVTLFPENDNIANSEQRIVTRQSELLQAELVPWALEIETADGTSTVPDASLKLICINGDEDGNFIISKDTFKDFFISMRADPAALYMICRDYDGFHTFHSTEHLPTWFIGTSAHALLWIFDPVGVRTIGIFTQRRRSIFIDFCRIVRMYAGFASTPYLMCFAACIQQQHHFDAETASELAVIHKIERCTGFGPNFRQSGGVLGIKSMESGHSQSSTQRHSSGADIDELTSWSQLVGEVNAKIANKVRHQRTFSQMLEAFKQAQAMGSQSMCISDDPTKQRYEAGQRALSEAVPAIERHMTAYAEYLTYLRLRTERLSSVLFILLTHEDARAAVSLAAATRRDGLSMKTIAIMTMAFLPGTFLAALFSMPSFQGQDSDSLKARLWVYWAITIPITIIVFLIWLATTERNWILRKLARHWKRVNVSHRIAP